MSIFEAKKVEELKESTASTTHPKDTSTLKPSGRVNASVTDGSKLSRYPDTSRTMTVEELREQLLGLTPPSKSSPVSTTPLVQSWRPQYSVFYAFLAIVVFILIIVLIASNWSKDFSKGAIIRICSSEGCIEHAGKLKLSLNLKQLPCQNFYTYVCGGNWGQQVSSSMEERTQFDLADAMKKDILRPPLAGSKPGLLYASCMSKITNTEKALAVFKEFKNSRGITWPENPQSSDIHPLDILLDLAINWNMGSWFNVHVMFATRSHPRIILIHDGTIQANWKDYLKWLNTTREDAKYVQAFYELLGAPPDDFITRLHDNEYRELETLISASSSDPIEDMFRLRQIEKYTPNIPADLWLSLLNKQYKHRYTFNLDEQVLVKDSKLLTAIANLIDTVPRQDLIVTIGWTFVQEYLWMASETDVSRDPTMKSRYCMRSLVTCYGLLPGITYFLKTYHPSIRDDIDALLNHTLERTIHLVNQSIWIDEVTKMTAITKIRNVTTTIWPHEDSMNLSRLESYFETFPNTSDLFVSSYLDVVKKISSLVHTEHFEDVYTKTYITRFTFFDYYYFLNRAVVAIAALSSPLYYASGTAAMNYGGLGAAYMKKVARLIDPQGVNVSVDYKRTAWWNKSTFQAYRNKSECLSNRGASYTSMSLIAALEVAFDAFVDTVLKSNETVDARLEDMRTYTPEQIFFITYCYATCSKEEQAEQECNVPLMNLSNFSSAFGCHPGSPMNPIEKCSFFL
ncbi:neprilysin-11-like isoform X2 [Ornithodoros turicata]